MYSNQQAVLVMVMVRRNKDASLTYHDGHWSMSLFTPLHSNLPVSGTDILEAYSLILGSLLALGDY
jgi:hypothetical protein